MQLKKLDKRVLKLWYIHAAIAAVALVGVIVSAAVILAVSGASADVALAVMLGIGVPVVLVLAFVLVMPALRFKAYAWGCDDKRIVVKQGVIFKQRVVIPICQIQDLHRLQGPLMMLMKVSGVTISTAGSNFGISTLTTEEADCLIDELERQLEVRVEEQKNEKI